MVYVFLANGFEEIEAITAIDVLRRSGIEAQTVGVGNMGTVKGANGVILCTDKTENEISKEETDGIVLPGGMPGAENLFESPVVKDMVEHCLKNNKPICAICAAPLILGRMGVLKNKNATCYPGFEKELTGAKISTEFICRDGNIITAKGPGVALEFALEVVKYFKGEEKVKSLKDSMQCV